MQLMQYRSEHSLLLARFLCAWKWESANEEAWRWLRWCIELIKAKINKNATRNPAATMMHSQHELLILTWRAATCSHNYADLIGWLVFNNNRPIRHCPDSSSPSSRYVRLLTDSLSLSFYDLSSSCFSFALQHNEHISCQKRSDKIDYGNCQRKMKNEERGEEEERKPVLGFNRARFD